MDFQTLISDLRATLVRKGTDDVVILRITNSLGGFVQSEAEVREMIDEFETKLLLAASGVDDVSPLTKLGIRLLLSAAHIPERNPDDRRNDEDRVDG
jgi:hypothetical protein